MLLITTLTTGLQQERHGARFELVADDGFAIAPIATPADRAAADGPDAAAARSAIGRKARDLSCHLRLTGQPGWRGLAEAAGLMAKLVSRSAVETADGIEMLWALYVSLGGYIDRDEGTRTIPRGSVLPLEIDLLRMLRDLVAPVRSWVRTLPTGRLLDDRALDPVPSSSKIKPAAEFLRSAERAEMFLGDHVRIVEIALAVGNCEGALAGKARGWAIWTMSNLATATLVTLGRLVEAEEAGTSVQPAKRSDLARTIERIVVENDNAVALLSHLPADRLDMLRNVIDGMRRGASDDV